MNKHGIREMVPISQAGDAGCLDKDRDGGERSDSIWRQDPKDLLMG